MFVVQLKCLREHTRPSAANHNNHWRDIFHRKTQPDKGHVMCAQLVVSHFPCDREESRAVSCQMQHTLTHRISTVVKRLPDVECKNTGYRKQHQTTNVWTAVTVESLSVWSKMYC